MDIIDVRKTEPKRVQRENEKGNRVKSDLFDYVCIIVHVAASQFTSSKLWSIVKPIMERLSKLLSPSTYLLLEDKWRGGRKRKTYTVHNHGISTQLPDLFDSQQDQALHNRGVIFTARRNDRG